jgi:hypothetical protein
MDSCTEEEKREEERREKEYLNQEILLDNNLPSLFTLLSKFNLITGEKV